MTRQERLNAIGQFKPSTFSAANAKNQMSYFIIPVPHEVYKKNKPENLIKKFKSLHWDVANISENAGRIFPEDARSMSSIKSYLYNYMVPGLKDEKSSIREFFSENNNILLQKNDLQKRWKFECVERGQTVYKTTFELDGLDLWIFDEHIAFFVLRTKLSIDDESTITDISSKFNRVMRDFRTLYVDTAAQCFSNNVSKGIKVEEWLYSLVEDAGQSLLSNSAKPAQKLQSCEKHYPVFNTSYHAKMITAIHIDEMAINGEEIEPSFTDDLMTRIIDGTSSLEEVPYHLASTGELYPDQMWENNEEYINSQIGDGEINIWKYWSGVALHDSLAFFSIGSGGSAIVNSARHSYYFIYILNLYVNYKLRYFEHRLIDSEFTSIENIRPMFTDLQRLRNQYMCTELSSLFQPNVVHSAINNAMKTEDIYDEIKDNIEVTLELTARNTDIMITVVVSLFSIAGLWLNQEMLLTFFSEHPYVAGVSSLILFIVISIGVVKRSVVIRQLKKWRKKIAALQRQFD